MSNNAWVDWDGGEMAYSQAFKLCMWHYPLFRNESDSIKTPRKFICEVIHCGKSIGITSAKNYYKDWFVPDGNNKKV